MARVWERKRPSGIVTGRVLLKCFQIVINTHALTGMIAVIALAACSNASAVVALPTANVQLRAVALPTLPAPTAAPTYVLTPVPTSAPPTPASTEAQYQVWIAEARTQYPYAESVAQMWAVLLCESGGNALASNGVNHGLFQYQDATWAGDWNPYRDQPITDARAQILATAKAWSDGNQHWWGCYGR